MPTIAVRGGKLLKEPELRSHLALATRLENVGALLGAGCSIDTGGLTIAQIWQHFARDYHDSYEWFRANRFLSDDEHRRPNTVNVELKLDVLATAELEWTRQDPTSAALSQLQEHRSNLYRSITAAAILNRQFWRNPESAHTDPSLATYRTFLTKLVGNRQPGQSSPWLFTTNYDLALEWTCESLGLHVLNGFSGLHSRTFAPHNFDLGFRNIQARGEARFGVYNCYLAKLHGSLTWISDNGQVVREISASHAFVGLERFLAGSGSANWPNVLIYPSASKYVQTTAFVYGELIRKFLEYLSRQQTCLLVCGYSFGDNHLNRVLMSALQNPTLHLVIFTPELTFNERSNVFAITDNRWLKELLMLQLPQVTFVGSDTEAFFAPMTSLLPEPALFDDRSEQARRLMRAIENVGRSGSPNGTPNGGPLPSA